MTKKQRRILRTMTREAEAAGLYDQPEVAPMPDSQMPDSQVTVTFVVVGQAALAWASDMVDAAHALARRHRLAVVAGETVAQPFPNFDSTKTT